MARRTSLVFLAVASFTLFALPVSADPIISVGTPITSNADLPSYLTDGSYPFGITVSLSPGEFLVPIDISGAVNLQTWQFDLLYSDAVVQQVDPGDGSFGVYGAEFTPPDLSSLAFILSSGFPIDQDSNGLPDDLQGVAGSYPSLLTGPSGDSPLAFVLFQCNPDPATCNGNFSIANTTVVQGVPEPATLALVLGGLAVLGGRRLAKRARGN